MWVTTAFRRLLALQGARGWDTVGAIVQCVVGNHLDARRLEGLVMIGCDEVSYRRGQRYLTTVCDHQTGAIVWPRGTRAPEAPGGRSLTAVDSP